MARIVHSLQSCALAIADHLATHYPDDPPQLRPHSLDSAQITWRGVSVWVEVDEPAPKIMIDPGTMRLHHLRYYPVSEWRAACEWAEMCTRHGYVGADGAYLVAHGVRKGGE